MTTTYTPLQRAAAALSGRYEIDWRESAREGYVEVSATVACLEDVRDELDDEADDVELVEHDDAAIRPPRGTLFLKPGEEQLEELLQEELEARPDYANPTREEYEGVLEEIVESFNTELEELQEDGDDVVGRLDDRIDDLTDHPTNSREAELAFALQARRRQYEVLREAVEDAIERLSNPSPYATTKVRSDLRAALEGSRETDGGRSR